MSEKGSKLDDSEVAIMRVLDNHKGKGSAIPADRLANRVDVTGRRLRQIINHLILEHLVPIASRAGVGGGYFLVETDRERHEFYWAFRHRGLTGLSKAARVQKQSLLETSLQLTLDQYMEDEKIPGAGEASSKLIKLFFKNPRLYAKEIEAFSTEAELLLIDRGKMAEINKYSKILAALTESY